MSTSPTTSLSEPTGSDKVPRGTFAYFRARLKHRVYSLLIGEFKRSKLSQADLCRRLDMEPAQLSRLLSGPGNLTLETTSDLLFAMSGAELSLSTAYPLAKHRGVPLSEIKIDPDKPVTGSHRLPTSMLKVKSNNPDIKIELPLAA
jgi:transcriptional regulator with XRE-family HTH domain